MLVYMKPITLHVDEPVYREFQRLASEQQRSTSALIREAMLEYEARHVTRGKPSLLDPPPPASVGGKGFDLPAREEMLADFLNREQE